MESTGRVNQKRRTRQAIVDAAQRLIESGTVPTVADAAAEAEVGRTTAYRYFPTHESLLIELAVSNNVVDVEELVAAPVSSADARARLREVVRLFNRHVLDEEVRYRTAGRLYQDQWLAAHAEGDAAPIVREGRRRRWFTQVLGPLMDEHGLSQDERERLINALALTCGTEPMVILRDVCHLDGDEALAVTDWVASLVLEATFGPTGRGTRS